MLDTAAAARAAAMLNDVRTSGAPMEALPSDLTPADAEDAYRIQEAGVAGVLDVAGGGVSVGRKVGATNPTAQEMLGVSEPFQAQLLSPFVLDSPAEIPADDMFMRVMEVEFAFRMGGETTTDGAPYDADSVRPLIAAVVPAIEIVDSRFTDWTSVGGLSVIADQGGGGRWVKGAEITDFAALDFAGYPVSISIDGALRESGTGAAVLGSPLNSLAWLANHLAARGQTLKAGEYVTTGSCTRPFPAAKGETAVADFGDLGQVSVRFI